MDMLLHNPIADMYGPQFLLFYSVIIVSTLVVCWRFIQDPTKKQPLPLIPTNPDPYEIAYLRGGETELTKLAVFNLIQRGYLQVKEKSIQQAPNYPDLGGLKLIESEFFKCFYSSHQADEMKFSSFLPVIVREKYAVYEQSLKNEQLLYADEWKAWNVKVGLVGAAIVFTLGSYKLLVALAKGRYNVGLLIVMGVVSLVMLLWLIKQPPRLSDRGQNYLKRLQGTFAQLQEKAKSSIPDALDYKLLVALFGVEALAGTSYDYYRKAFLPPPSPNRLSRRGSNSRQRSSSDSSCSSSSCGSSCSSSFDSSCSSSSSCGSSCSSSSDSSCSGSSCGSSCGGGCGGCGG
ncbi:TIGR04222 domain-containing membrane protein [Microcoleus sp. FACHB-831]|uniref:TIGR04222 domain-containing membrane protein n=1 Tax=Microcoleus sp. FACHB-831 TaxID=2692827 RepID=UPI001688A8CD|nr:TIGR04222 domain-containing membrane protein [Microcoleus sp. FACHB-831]MBD1923576.1 TIGR04222 domain-containing membrane protein [Microcoleus sp. FACHB-831]